MLRADEYQGNPLRHFMMEMSGAILALCAAVVCFNYSLERREGLSPYVVVAFLAAGLTDLLHAVFAMGMLIVPLADMDRFIPGSWTAGRTVLGLILLVGLIRVRGNPAARPAIAKLALFVGGAVIAALLFFAVTPLPAFILTDLPLIHRPWELPALILFGVCLVLILRTDDPSGMEQLLVAPLAIGIVTQAFMMFSDELFDPFFDGSHLLKVVSYAAFLAPLTVATWRRRKYSIQINSTLILSGSSIVLIVMTMFGVVDLAIEHTAERIRETDEEKVRVLGKFQADLLRLTDPIHDVLLSGGRRSTEDFETIYAEILQDIDLEVLRDLQTEHQVDFAMALNEFKSLSDVISREIAPLSEARLVELNAELDSIADRRIAAVAAILDEEWRQIGADSDRTEFFLSTLLFAGMGIVLILLPLLFVLANVQLRRQLAPILELTELSKRIHAGERDERLTEIGTDEIGTLGTSINSMLDAVQESEARYADLIEHGNDLIQSVAPDGSYLFVNPAWRKTLGYSEEEVQSLSMTDVIHPDNLEHCMNIFKRLMSGEAVDRIEAVFQTKDGRSIFVEGSISCSFDDGAPIATRGMFTDVTDRKRWERSQVEAREKLERSVEERTQDLATLTEDLRRIIETANAPIFGIDTEGRVNEWNQAAERITGYSKDTVMGRLFVEEYIGEETRDSVSRVLDKALAGEATTNYEFPIYTKAGRRVDLLLNASPRRDGEGRVIGVISIGQDITEIKAFQAELEGEVDARTQELRQSLQRIETANIQLAEANRHKSRFLSSMSHELRTPLNSIIGFSDLLGEELFGGLNAKQHEYIKDIKTSGKQLLELINDLLDTARIDSGTMELNLEVLRPGDLLEAPIRMFQVQAHSKGIDLGQIVDPGLDELVGDRRRLRQVVLNFLSNALKYTPAGGKIEVRATKQDNLARISVADTGVGIQPDQAQRLFSEFYQADRKRDEALGGVGLGLALSRRLVELHGGEIGVESELDKGSTFWFTVPIRGKISADESVEEQTPKEALTAVPVGKRILVAEDNETNLTLVLDILSAYDHRVTVARNGREAVDLARSSKPELILMDVRMPMMGGLEATRELRAMPEFAEIPIIALTASVGEDAEQRCLEAGCTAYLPKPIAIKELRAALTKYLTSSLPGRKEIDS